MATHYVRNERGHIHSVDEDHFQNRLHVTTDAGNQFLLPGWSEVDEAVARKENPQLFGEPDPEVTAAKTVAELEAELKRREQLQALGSRPE
jgi:hypothetical protein